MDHLCRLKHQLNLNYEDLEPRSLELSSLIGEPDDQSDDYGFFRKWITDNFSRTIRERHQHGSSWGAILIENLG
jgi:hypothetical protein